MPNKTQKRKRHRGGGEQEKHSLSQLKRFVMRAKEDKPFKILQFGYNLGRLQEMVDPKISGAQKYWWSPVEKLVEEKKWDELLELIEKFRTEKVNEEYDGPTVNKD